MELLSHYNAITFDPRRVLLFERIAIQVLVRNEADFVRVNAWTFFVSSNAEEPATDRYCQGVEHRGLAHGIITNKQIEFRIESEFA
jgi:hypothetical protein